MKAFNSQPTRPLMRYHGGKWRIAQWVIAHFPPHEVYVEPFGGAAGVLLQKPRARAEVYNDLDDEIVNVFRVLRDPDLAAELRRVCELTPYARSEFELAQESSPDAVESARRTLFRAWASFGSAGATRGRSGFRTFTREGQYSPVTDSLLRVTELLPAFTERLRGVIIENRPAIDVMQLHDGPNTLHYVDPPYLPETRKFDGGRYYRYEMLREDHEQLLHELKNLQGMVIVSGYASELYNDALNGWRRIDKNVTASSRKGSVKRVENLWLSPNCTAGQQSLAI